MPSIYKDHAPITQQSMIVYQYMCRCDCRYVGRTSLRLQDRINQHIPKSIRNNQKPNRILLKRNYKEKINTTKPPQCNSAIGLHLLQNKQCANNYNDQQISILARARNAFASNTDRTMHLFCYVFMLINIGMTLSLELVVMLDVKLILASLINFLDSNVLKIKISQICLINCCWI